MEKEKSSSGGEEHAAALAAMQASHTAALAAKDVEIQRIQEEILILQKAAAENAAASKDAAG